MTPTASRAIRELVASNESAGAAGVRIAPAEGSPGALSLTLTGGPQEDDQVVPIQDGQVFLEASTADALHDKTLDAQIDDQGGASFSVVDQATS